MPVESAAVGASSGSRVSCAVIFPGHPVPYLARFGPREHIPIGCVALLAQQRDRVSTPRECSVKRCAKGCNPLTASPDDRVDMNGLGEAARKAFEQVLDKVRAERRQLDAWECECLRAALVMMAMNDNAAAQLAIQGSERAPPGVDVNLQPTSTIEDMRACLAMLVRH